MIELLKEILEFIGIFIVIGIFTIGVIGTVYWLIISWIDGGFDE